MPEYDIPGMKRVVNKNFAFVVVFRTSDTPINRGLLVTSLQATWKYVVRDASSDSWPDRRHAPSGVSDR
jgi:hypothetical protein